ncbi:site-specific integrase [Achromobacter sp. GG226]|uniref:tyrosine-type recombinase/integrase n=1 Tax=Verticiella alkaliphila TaxID=2779529 RepID=UPI001C0C0F69|nr:site-specific integrase [Verticiella sp. GG226]MBU4609191.1 site-specific integrase [Verticiella sp. GG226]
MPIYREKTRGRFIFEFDRQIGGQRVRARKLLPKTWTQAQADTFDRQESARLYAIGTSVQRPEHLIEDAVAVYLKERAPRLKSGDNIARELAQMYWAYKGRPLSALTEACRFYSAKAVKDDGAPLSPATLRNRIRYLTSACRYAWRHHSMCEHDPAAGVPVPHVSNERQHYVSRQEMLMLVRHCTNLKARKAIRVAFYSGMRLSEILRAVPRANGFHLQDTKNGAPRIVPIHPRIAFCARRMPTGPNITIQRAFERARTRAGLPHVHFHDLRHSAASELINAGVDLYTVGRVLGHKDPRSTQRYSHLAVDTLAAAIGKIGGKAA